MAGYCIISTGESRSFPAPHAFLEGANSSGPAIVLLGDPSLPSLDATALETATFVLVELGTECLAVHGGLSADEGRDNLLGFARFRLGDAEPSNLVELVRQPWTSDAALAAAQSALEGAGLVVAVCEDFAGRIIDRLIRPYLNATLRRLDEGLATAADLDKTLRMGLGYPEGPITLLARTGLEHHYDVSQALFEAWGEQPYAPARAARIAKQRVGARR